MCPPGKRREPRTSYSLRTDCPTSVSPRGRRRDHVRVRVDGFKALTQDGGPDVAAKLAQVDEDLIARDLDAEGLNSRIRH